MFDRPKPTAGCSANGRRRRIIRRRGRRRGRGRRRRGKKGRGRRRRRFERKFIRKIYVFCWHELRKFRRSDAHLA